MNATIHKFEAAGLGKAPFRFVGFTPAPETDNNGMVKTEVDGITHMTKPGCACHYCGQYITNIYKIQSADGKISKVGSSCVNKTGDKGLVNVVKKHANKLKREKRVIRESARIEAAKKTLETEEIASFLKEWPHPAQFQADKSRNLYDYVVWMFNNAGHSGQFKVTKIVEKAQKEVQ